MITVLLTSVIIKICLFYILTKFDENDSDYNDGADDYNNINMKK